MNVYLLLREVYPFLVLFLALDAIKRVPPYRRLVFSRLGRRFHYGRAGYVLALPFPASRAFVVASARAILGSRGLLVLRRPGLEVDLTHPLAFREVPFGTEASLTARGNEVFVDGKLVATESSPTRARRLLESFARMRDEDESREHRLDDEQVEFRNREIRSEIDRSMNMRSIRAELDAFRRQIGLVEFLAWTLLGLLVLLVPTYLYGPTSFRAPLLPGVIVGLLIVNYGALVWVGSTMFRHLGDRVSKIKLIPVLLSPVTAVHLPGYLGESLLMDYDAIAVAAVLLPSDESWPQVRSAYWQAQRASTRLQRSGSENLVAPPPPSAESFWSARIEAVEALAGELGFDAERFREPPADARPGEPFCPSCGSTFAPGATDCPDCSMKLLLAD